MNRRSVSALVALTLVVCVGCPILAPPAVVVEFSYSGETGPDHWGELSEEWVACGDGMEQSPVDIVNAVLNEELPDLGPDYHATPANLLNNGHTWEVEYEEGSTLTLGTETYELLQFHFHTPAEHTVGGTLADMEMHLVHRNEAGNLAVIGVLFNAGAESAFLAQFWNDFPQEEGEAHEDYEIDVSDGLPEDLSYYTYPGSLTTPPCSEIVTWIVLKTPLEASQAQIDAINDVFGDNARPVQDLDGRTIEEN